MFFSKPELSLQSHFSVRVLSTHVYRTVAPEMSPNDCHGSIPLSDA